MHSIAAVHRLWSCQWSDHLVDLWFVGLDQWSVIVVCDCLLGLWSKGVTVCTLQSQRAAGWDKVCVCKRVYICWLRVSLSWALLWGPDALPCRKPCLQTLRTCPAPPISSIRLYLSFRTHIYFRHLMPFWTAADCVNKSLEPWTAHRVMCLKAKCILWMDYFTLLLCIWNYLSFCCFCLVSYVLLRISSITLISKAFFLIPKVMINLAPLRPHRHDLTMQPVSQWRSWMLLSLVSDKAWCRLMLLCVVWWRAENTGFIVSVLLWLVPHSGAHSSLCLAASICLCPGHWDS